MSFRTIAPFSLLLTLIACGSDPTPMETPDAAAPTEDAGVSDAAAEAEADAAPSAGKACLDSKSTGDGTPYTCDVLPAGLSEQDTTTVCGAFSLVDACPTEGRTYRCGNAKSLVVPTVRTERFYYLVKKPSADTATMEDCAARDGDYSVL